MCSTCLQIVSLENRCVSNLIEVMADERWKRLAEQQGVAYAKTVAEAMKLKLDMDNPADREKLRRAFSILSPGKKCERKHGAVEILSFTSWQAFCSAIHLVKTGEASSDCHVMNGIILCKCGSQRIFFPNGWSDEQ